MSTMMISAINVENRHRKDLGDLGPLMKSIEDVGLLHPAVITDEGARLVAGARRLESCKRLGWETIPVTIADTWEDAEKALHAERDENTCRLDMKPSEKATLGHALEAIYRPDAQERKRNSNPMGSQEPMGSGQRDEKARVREKVGEALGMGGATYQRLSRVANDAKDPELSEEQRAAAAAALAAMDAGKAIKSTYQAYMKSLPKPPSTNGATKTPPPLDLSSAHNLAVATKAKERLWNVISGLSGYQQGLKDFRLDRALVVASPEEIKDWISILKSAAKSFKDLARDLEKLPSNQ